MYPTQPHRLPLNAAQRSPPAAPYAQLPTPQAIPATPYHYQQQQQQYYNPQQAFPQAPLSAAASSYFPYPHAAYSQYGQPHHPAQAAVDPSVDVLMSHLSSSVDDGTKDAQQSWADMMLLAGLQSSHPPQPAVVAHTLAPNQQQQRAVPSQQASIASPSPMHPSPPATRHSFPTTAPALPAPAPSAPSSPLLSQLSFLLQRHFGYRTLLTFQLRTLESLLLDKKDVLLVNRRHTGRASCYQLAALLTHKLAVVLCPTSRPSAAAQSRQMTGTIDSDDSPLQQQWQIGWMQDQVLSLRQRGINAVALSYASMDSQTLAELRASPGSVSVLYLSIFSAERCIDDLAYLHSIDAVCTLAVEESQCASESSPDYRAEYGRIAAIRAALVERSAVLRSKRVQEEGSGGAVVGRLPLLAICAPCDSQTQLDVLRAFSFPASKHVHIPAHSDFGLLLQRPNVGLHVKHKSTVAEDMMRLFQQHPEVKKRRQRETAQQAPHRSADTGAADLAASSGGTGADDGISGAREGERRFYDLASLRECGLSVIYCASKKTCHELQDFLLNSLHIRSAVMHAGLTEAQKLSAVRTAHFHQVEVVITSCTSVATFFIPPTPPDPVHDNSPALSSASFVDKPDTRRVIFYGMPLSLESFMQLTADVGRDGAPGSISLYYSTEEYHTARALLSSMCNGEVLRRHLWNLDNVRAYAESTMCRKQVLRRYFDWHPSGASGSIIGGVDDSPVQDGKPDQSLSHVSTEPYAPGEPVGAQCGQCDNCLARNPGLLCHSYYAQDDTLLPSSGPPSSLDLGDASYLLLSAVHQTGARFPIDVPIAVLRGEHVHAVLTNSFHRLTVFARGACLTFRYWLALADILVRKGYIALVSSDSALTNKGLAFLKSPPVPSQQSASAEGGKVGSSSAFSHVVSELPRSSLWYPSQPVATPAPLPYASQIYGRPLYVDSDQNAARLSWLHMMSAQLLGLAGSESAVAASSLLPCELNEDEDDRAVYVSLCHLTYHNAYSNGHHPALVMQNHQLAVLARFRPNSRESLVLTAAVAGVSTFVMESWGAKLMEAVAQQAQAKESTAAGRATDARAGGSALQVAPRGAALPVIGFHDVFSSIPEAASLGASRPVRAMNHAQMTVWQQFEGGDTIRSISDQRGLKPHVVLAYIVYCLESFSPSPRHPIFLHWPRFNIPQELFEKIGAAIDSIGGVFGRLDVIRAQLGEEDVLEEDVRIAMIRWKMERAVGSHYQSYDVYRVMTVEEAKERLARQAQDEDTGHDPPAAADDHKAADGANKPKAAAGGGEAHEESKTGEPAAAGFSGRRAEDMEMVDGSLKAQPAGGKEDNRPSAAASTRATASVVPRRPFVIPSGAPALTSGEMLHYLTLHGGVSSRCLTGHFQVDWAQIEAVISKLIAEQLVWKRGLLYCPT